MTTNLGSATLGECLGNFRDRFNDNPRVMKLIAGWDREILVEPLDTPSAYTLTIENLQMTRVSPGISGHQGRVHMRASEEVFKQIFRGECHPARALSDGSLAVSSEARDRGKLEALGMVIWGV
jgi:hypothetical protein